MIAAARRLAQALAQRGAERVILFGSLLDAERAAPDADVDMVVVMPGLENERFHKRLSDLPEVEQFPYPLHLFAYTPDEWEQVRSRWFIREEVLGKGVVLFERD
ncbi:MAG TPA: nucleotidyltransferase domain-containing protein [Bacillota bacterium]